MTAGRMAAELPAEGESILVGQGSVEERQVERNRRLFRSEGYPGRLRVGAAHRLVASGFQCRQNRGPGGGVVFDDQNSHQEPASPTGWPGYLSARPLAGCSP